MADAPETEADPFDEAQLETPSSSASPAAPESEPAEEGAAPSQELPRGPDGKFLPRKAAAPAHLVRAAKELGWDDDEIAGFTPEQLAAAVVREQRRLYQQTLEFARQRTVTAGETRPQAPPEPDESIDFGRAPDGTPYTEADLGEPQKAILAVIRKQAAKIKELEGTTKQAVEREQARTQQAFFDLVDEAFEGLGEADESLVGKGSVKDLMKDDPARDRRQSILDRSGAIVTDSPRTIAKKIKAARDRLYPAAAATPKPPVEPEESAYGEQPPAKSKKAPTPEEYAKAALVKPTSRKADELPPGKEKAMRTVTAGMAAGKYGLGTGASEENELNGVPE